MALVVMQPFEYVHDADRTRGFRQHPVSEAQRETAGGR